MKLQRVEENPRPGYPLRREVGLRRLVRRAAAVAVAAGSLWLAGCDLSDPFEPRLAGDVAPVSAFWCGEAEPESPPELGLSGYSEGALCGTETAWAALTLETQRELRLSFPYGVTNVTIDVISPDDEVLGQLTPDVPELVLTLEPGRWLLSATPDDPEASQWDWFTLSIEDVEAGD